MVLFIRIFLTINATFVSAAYANVIYNATGHLFFKFKKETQLRRIYFVNETEGLHERTVTYAYFIFTYEKKEDRYNFEVWDTDKTLRKTLFTNKTKPRDTSVTYSLSDMSEILNIIFISRRIHIYSETRISLLKYDKGNIVYEFTEPETVTLVCVNFGNRVEYLLKFDDSEATEPEVKKTWHIDPGFNNRTFECIAREKVNYQARSEPVEHKEKIVFRYKPPTIEEIETTKAPHTQKSQSAEQNKDMEDTPDLLWVWIVVPVAGISIIILLLTCAYSHCRSSSNQVFETSSVLTRRTAGSTEVLNENNEEPKPSDLYYSYARLYKTPTYDDYTVAESSTSYETIKDKPTLKRIQVNNADYTLAGKKCSNNEDKEELYDGYNVIKEKSRHQAKSSRNNEDYQTPYVNESSNISGTNGKRKNDNGSNENNSFKNDLMNAIAQRKNY